MLIFIIYTYVPEIGRYFTDILYEVYPYVTKRPTERAADPVLSKFCTRRPGVATQLLVCQFVATLVNNS